jgi:hypothetical protein
MRVLGNRWLPLALTTSAALGIWAIAAAHGCAWQMIWLPAVVAGAAWPRDRKRPLRHCLRRPRRQHGGNA